MKKRTIAIAAVGVLALGGALAAVSAQGHRSGWHGGHMMFGDDEGGHGMRGRFGRAVTKEDFDRRMRERFASIDRNSDGVIDAGEIEAAMASHVENMKGRHGGMVDRMEGRIKRMFDANRDGKVTKDEVRAEILRRFAEMDINNDGRIDDNDLPPMMRGRNVLAGGDGHGMGWMAGAGKGPRGRGGLGLLRQADANKDGVITREEAEALGDREFARFDRNKDGAVDQADVDSLRKETAEYRVKRFAHRFGAGADGRVTREQFLLKASERFARMDYDNDGTISRDEQPGRGHGRRSGRHGMRHGDGGHGGMMRHGPALQQGPNPGSTPAEAPPAKN